MVTSSQNQLFSAFNHKNIPFAFSRSEGEREHVGLEPLGPHERLNLHDQRGQVADLSLQMQQIIRTEQAEAAAQKRMPFFSSKSIVEFH